MNMPKRSKLEAFRLYLLSQSIGHLVIRYNGDEDRIQTELDKIWLDLQKVDKISHSCPTLSNMNEFIENNAFLEKYR